MPLTTPPNPQRTIVLKCQSLGGTSYREGRVATAKTIKPGHLVEKTVAGAYLPDGSWQPHSTAAGPAEAVVAMELGFVADIPYQAFSGGTIDDSYAAGDLVRMHHCKPGDEVYLRVATGAGAIVLTDFLTSAGDGTVKKGATTDTRLFKALEALTNTSGADAFIRAAAI